MKYYLKQHLFTLRDRFSVYDADENEFFTVKGDLFRIGKQFHIYYPDGGEIAYVKQKVVSFLPQYHVFRHGECFAKIIKELSFFRPKYRIEGPNWRVEGDLFAHDYRITDGIQEIASVHKQWLSWGDTYEINVSYEADHIAALAVVLAIDACLAAQNNN